MELLTNEVWLNPQVDYLLWLQNIRNVTGGVLDQFFLNVSKLGEILWPTVVVCIVYWCIDFKFGLYLFTLNSFTLICSQLFKLSACIYRPWILDDRIVPMQATLKTAESYSFPSGHSMMAISTWGGMVYLWRKNKLLSGFLIFLVLLVAFSRNYLGVHMPQDVIIGLLTGAIFIFTVMPLLNWCEKSKNRYLWVLLVVNIISASIMFYILTKSYPMDYINGKLLVNPERAIHISFLYFGWLLGLLNGAFLCKRFFPFDASEGSLKEKIIRGVAGVILLLWLFSYIQIYLLNSQQNLPITFVLSFFVAFFITAIYPLIFTKIANVIRK